MKKIHFEYNLEIDGVGNIDGYAVLNLSEEDINEIAKIATPSMKLTDLPELYLKRFKDAAFEQTVDQCADNNIAFMPDMKYYVELEEELPVDLLEALPEEVQDTIRRSKIETKWDFFEYLYWKLSDEDNKALKESDDSGDFHFGLGSWLRNEFMYTTEDSEEGDLLTRLFSDVDNAIEIEGKVFHMRIVNTDSLSDKAIEEYQQFLRQYR